MHISLPSYPDPDDDETPIAGAVVKILSRETNEQFGSGKVHVGVYRTAKIAERAGTTLWQGDILFGTQLNDTSFNTRLRIGDPSRAVETPVFFPRAPQIDEEAAALAREEPGLSPGDAVLKVLYTHLRDVAMFKDGEIVV